MPYLTVYHGNPHSRTHMYGWESEAAVEHARQVNILDLWVFTFQLYIISKRNYLFLFFNSK